MRAAQDTLKVATEADNRCACAWSATCSRSAFLDQCRALLRHLVHLGDGLVNLLDAAALLLSSVCNHVHPGVYLSAPLLSPGDQDQDRAARAHSCASQERQAGVGPPLHDHMTS